MQRLLLSFCVVACLVGLAVFPAASVSDDGAAISIAIEVAPNVLNLDSQGECVTVHTDIAYGAVVGATVTLNGVEIDYWKSDNRGYFVAKFEIDEIKDIVEPGTATLTLTGVTCDGDEFRGVDQVKVIKRSGR